MALQRSEKCVCSDPGPHFVPPSFGEPGFYACDPEKYPPEPTEDNVEQTGEALDRLQRTIEAEFARGNNVEQELRRRVAELEAEVEKLKKKNGELKVELRRVKYKLSDWE